MSSLDLADPGQHVSRHVADLASRLVNSSLTQVINTVMGAATKISFYGTKSHDDCI